MNKPDHWRHPLLKILAVSGVLPFVWFCLLGASTSYEQCFVATLWIATALAIGFASRRAWFGLLCSTALYALTWSSSALKFKYLEVPAIAPDLYYFFSFDTVKVIAGYPLLALACLLMLLGIPLALWLAWHSDQPAKLPHLRLGRRRWWRRLGLVGSVLVLAASLTPNGLYGGAFGKPMWLAVNDRSYIVNFVISFYDTQIHVPPKTGADDGSVSWEASGATIPDPLALDGFEPHGAAATNLMQPDIVAVLEESTFDPSIMTLCHTLEICKRSMFAADARTIAHGLLGVHTFGGGTWTSEFALITGLAHTLFGNAGLYAPYNLAPRVQYSIAKSLKAKGYRVVALYPMNADFINARNAYREYGFDMLYDGGELGLSAHPHDQTVFDLFWKLYQQERQDHPDQPIFFFVLTLRQHGPHMTAYKKMRAPYDKPLFPGKFSTSNRPLDDWLNLNVANYLQRNAESDRAMHDLETRLLDRDQPTLLLHFGDHQPSFEGAIMVVAKTLPKDWGDKPHWATYYMLKSNLADAPHYAYPILDIVYLGGLVLDAAGVSPDSYYVANRLLRERCAGRYEECADTRMLPSYHDYVFHHIGMLGQE